MVLGGGLGVAPGVLVSGGILGLCMYCVAGTLRLGCSGGLI